MEQGEISLIAPLEIRRDTAPNQTWSADGRLLAYHDMVDRVLVLFVYDSETGSVRQLFDSTSTSFAPNWICDSYTLVFTANVYDQPDIFAFDATPRDAEIMPVVPVSERLTMTDANDIYPRNLPVTDDKLMFIIASSETGTGRIVQQE